MGLADQPVAALCHKIRWGVIEEDTPAFAFGLPPPPSGLTDITRDIGRDCVQGTPRLHLHPRPQAVERCSFLGVVHGASGQVALTKEWQRCAHVPLCPALASSCS